MSDSVSHNDRIADAIAKLPELEDRLGDVPRDSDDFKPFAVETATAWAIANLDRVLGSSEAEAYALGELIAVSMVVGLVNVDWDAVFARLARRRRAGILTPTELRLVGRPS